MPKHGDFAKIYASMIATYGKKKGKQVYYAWLNSRGYDDTISYAANKRRNPHMRLDR